MLAFVDGSEYDFPSLAFKGVHDLITLLAFTGDETDPEAFQVLWALQWNEVNFIYSYVVIILGFFYM